MEYNTQNYWVFGLFPSSGILETRKHDVSETGHCFRPQVRCLLPTHLRTETDPVSKTSCSLASRIPDDGKSPKTQ
jgi:hypothetical protein